MLYYLIERYYILFIISAAPNILMAYEKITAIQDTADIGQVINKSGKLAKAATAAKA